MRPSIGRIVHFRTNEEQTEPYAAIVTKVWNDTNVNVTVFREDGSTQSETSVPHFSSITGGRQWSWPPLVQ